MAVLVTRPEPDNGATAATLRARGFEVLLAPMLRFEALAFQDDADAHYDAVIVTSANALRGFERHPSGRRLLELPLFAVGEHTADAARHAGFGHVIAAHGDVVALRDAVLAGVKAKQVKKAGTLLYLAGDLGERGFTVVTHTTYRMIPVAELPPAAREGFAANQVAAVLHYSRRSARAFLQAARTAGVEISALAIPQCCISEAVASVVRDAGATQVLTASRPDENALLEALMRALRP